MTALLASMLGVLVGMVIGAATQRWGDADRATHGHKVYESEDVTPHWVKHKLTYNDLADLGLEEGPSYSQ